MAQTAFCLLLLGLSAVANAKPLSADGPVIQRRHHETTTLTVTSWAPAITTTVNPGDPTVTETEDTRTIVEPFTSTISQTAGHTSEFIMPPEGHAPDTETFTYETRSTVTVEDTNEPTTTRTVWTTPTVTSTSGTVLQYEYPHTLVVSYVDHAEATWTWSDWEDGVTYTTGACLTTSTRSTTIPGVTLPTTRPLEDWEYFSDVPAGGRVTKYSVAIVYETFVTFPGQYTSTMCNSNPTSTTTITISVTRQPTTTTVYTADPAECTDNAKRAEAGLKKREEVEQGAVTEPVEVHTVVYTTVTVIDNTVHTLTGTAVVEVDQKTIVRTLIEYTTTTGTGVATSTSWVCSLPANSS